MLTEQDFEIAYQRRNKLLSIAIRRLGNFAAEAEDIVAAAFLSAWQHRANITGGLDGYIAVAVVMMCRNRRIGNRAADRFSGLSTIAIATDSIAGRMRSVGFPTGYDLIRQAEILKLVRESERNLWAHVIEAGHHTFGKVADHAQAIRLSKQKKKLRNAMKTTTSGLLVAAMFLLLSAPAIKAETQANVDWQARKAQMLHDNDGWNIFGMMEHFGGWLRGVCGYENYTVY